MAERFPYVPGVKHRFVDIAAGDGRLRVHLAEAGSGPPLLLLHGWPQHWYMWRRLVPRLSGARHMLMPDLRGFGWTDAPGRGYDPETFAADAVALLDALEIERVDLVGHDWGGYSAYFAGLATPQRFRRIVTLNAPVPWKRFSRDLLPQAAYGWYGSVNAWLGKRMHSASPTWVGWNLRRALVDPSAITSGAAGIFARRYLPPERAYAAQQLYRAYQRAFVDILVRRRFEGMRLTVPTRLVWGEQDVFLVRAMAEGADGHADDFELEYVPDAGHFIAEEKPELVADRIQAFMGDAGT